MKLLKSKKKQLLMIWGLLSCFVFSTFIPVMITPPQEQRTFEVEDISIPNANSYHEISHTLYMNEALEEIAFWEDELWGVLHSNNSIAEISSDTGEIIRFLPDLGITPSGMAASEEYIYLSGRDGIGNGTVYSINKTTGTIEDSFDVFGEDAYSFGIEYDDGYLWMDQTNDTRWDCNLLKVDAATGTIVANYSSPYRITAGPQLNGIVFCIAYDINTILGFNQNTGQIVCNFSYPVGSTGEWGSSQHRGNLVLSNYNIDELFYIRMQYSTGETVFNIEVEGRYDFPFRATNNGTHLFLRPDLIHEIKILDIGTGAEVGTFSLSYLPQGITYFDNYLWITEAQTPYHIHKLETDGTEVMSFSVDPTNPLIYDLTHDGTDLWGTLSNRTMVKINPTSQSIVESYETNLQIYCIAYSNETEKILGCSFWDRNAIFQFDPTAGKLNFEGTIAVSTDYITGITLWEDKIILVGKVDSLWNIAYLQNNNDFRTSLTDDDTNGDDIPMLFGFNALYVVAAGAGAGLLSGLVLGGILFRKKKK